MKDQDYYVIAGVASPRWYGSPELTVNGKPQFEDFEGKI